MRTISPLSPHREHRAYPSHLVFVMVWVGFVLLGRDSAAADLSALDQRSQPAETPLAPDIVPEKSPESGHYRYDTIYVRLYAGPAYFMGREAYTSDPYSGSQQRRHRTQLGLGVGCGALVGAAIRQRLIIYGEIVGSRVSHPTVTNNYDGVLITNHVDQFAVGVGVAYFFEPRSYHLSGTLTFPKAWFDYSSQSQFPNSARDKTNFGVGVNLMVGREWWIGRQWAIGMAAQVHLATMGYPAYGSAFDPDMRLYSGTFALLLSASHN